jgi:hypothetical protein
MRLVWIFAEKKFKEPTESLEHGQRLFCTQSPPTFKPTNMWWWPYFKFGELFAKNYSSDKIEGTESRLPLLIFCKKK